ncbi:BppU family phage baseplate upper protein (plasmid) [Staphylococcus carnosus]|uniref:BppU family phage baseplate upper protein n=1 Tax=Staphylococcus carnosus TaxID=1281 RepID=UPI00191AA5C2|nr:BppU family phage baseplate upper protein [Staphylococcus carnosus]QQS86532.1 BppU family phage baseplate upper protein [Staphylococcus carnosus]
MANGIDKKALFKFKSEPYLKPISDLGVGFYNLDENTAILRFQLSNTKGPLLIHENNLTAYAYFESTNGSVSDVIELEIEDSHQGIVTITVDKEFLQASTSTSVTGQVYIAVNNVDGNPEYNEVAVFREFTFEVADALINKISAFTKIEYIRMFDQLKMRIEQKVRDIEEAIANGADYVAEMKSVLPQGVETLNTIVADGKSDIQAYIAQAKTDLTNVKDDATEDITTVANNAKSSVQDTASTAVNSINLSTTEATEHVDAKVTEFNQTVEDNGFLSPQILDEELGNLNWQKHKLTNDDGTYPTIALGSNLDNLYALAPGNYYTTSTPITGVSSTAGFTRIELREGTVKHITFRPYNSTQIWLKRFYNNWSEWERVDNTQSDTGWVPFNLINGSSSNTEYDGKGGFKCAYRTVINGTVTTNYIRLNGRNITDGQTIAQIPSAMVKNAQTFPVRTPTNKPVVFITIYTDGSIALLVNKSTSTNEWGPTDYIYGEFSWTN